MGVSIAAKSEVRYICTKVPQSMMAASADQGRFAHRTISFHFASSRARFAAIHASGCRSLREGRTVPLTSSVSISTVQRLPSRNST